MGSMYFSSADLYPTLATKSNTETSLEANPDRDDLDALGEDSKAVVGGKEARGSTIIIAVLIMFALVVFFGIN